MNRLLASNAISIDASQSNNRRRPRFQSVAVVLLCVSGLNACATDNKAIVDAEQDKQALLKATVAQLKDHQQQSDAQYTQQAALLSEFQSRLDELEQKLDALGNTSQAEQAQINALSSHIDRLHRKKLKQTAKARPASTAVDHAKKTSTVKSKPNQTAAAIKPRSSVVVPKAIKAAAIPKVDQAAVAEAEKNTYTSAYLALKSGSFDEAGKAFNAQLDKYPAGEYADQAWYWLGETRFAQNNTDKALNAFKYVADHYPNSVKHAAALLKLGQLSEMQNHWQAALSYYKRLISDHADSSLAEQARDAVNRVQPRIKPSGE